MKIKTQVFYRVFVTLTLFLLLSTILILSGCNPDKYIDSANVYQTFENDYNDLKEVTDYLLSLNLHMIVIENSCDPITIDYGEKMEIDNIEIKNTIDKLFQKGYISISSIDNTLCFERWKKRGAYEYRSGFVYSYDVNGDLDIQYVVSQEKLSVSNWYFYEEDYNEWRVRNSE